jgi:putative solute:sodium symporter small subunit
MIRHAPGVQFTVTSCSLAADQVTCQRQTAGRCNFPEESKLLVWTSITTIINGGSDMDTRNTEYWRANIRLVTGCLLVWFIVSFGCGILLVDFFNQFQIGGYKLGFWFAQQDSIFTFLILIFFYAIRMNALDRRYGVSED